jgi:transposase
MSAEERSALRKVIVRLHIQGESNGKITKLLGVSLRHVESALKKYKEGGLEAIAFKKIGRPNGSTRILTTVQQDKIKEVLITQKPEEYKLNGFLWSMDLVRILIKILFNIEIKRSTMAMCFRYWGYAPQRPIIYNSKQNSEMVGRWIEEEYPINLNSPIHYHTKLILFIDF